MNSPCWFRSDFKLVNDKYGHHVGDLYLQEAALRMKRQLRPSDILARLGGDEFAVLVPASYEAGQTSRRSHCGWSDALTSPSPPRITLCRDRPASESPSTPLTQPPCTLFSAPPTPPCTKQTMPRRQLARCGSPCRSLTSFRNVARKKRPGLRRASDSSKKLPPILLGSHLFRFAFLAHELQFALGRFNLGRNFLLHASCRFFQFR